MEGTMNRKANGLTKSAGQHALLAGYFSLALAGQSMATPPVGAPLDKTAQRCTSDLRAFHDELQKGGYWLHSAYGFGYPMYGYMIGERGVVLPSASAASVSELHARPGYEIRTLMASASIMAQRGQQAACEALLAATREIYVDYVTGLRKKGVAKSDKAGWQNYLLAAALPVSVTTGPFRSDQLIGTDVVTPHNESLGTVDDIVVSPKSGKVTYLVISHTGLLGIDMQYVPVPWEDFKVTPGATLLVLDSTRSTLDAGPQVKEDEFSANGGFAEERQKVDDYWKSHLSQ
jgi:sporulation protein YlmC with PRC-barrel domain